MRRAYLMTVPDGYEYKVLACPICGSGTIVYDVKQKDDQKCNRLLYRIRCSACGCFGKESRILLFAAWKWNKLKKVKRKHHIFGKEY